MAEPVFIPQYNLAAQAKIPCIKNVQVKNIIVGIIISRFQIHPFCPVTICVNTVQVCIFQLVPVMPCPESKVHTGGKIISTAENGSYISKFPPCKNGFIHTIENE